MRIGFIELDIRPNSDSFLTVIPRGLNAIFTGTVIMPGPDGFQKSSHGGISLLKELFRLIKEAEL